MNIIRHSRVAFGLCGFASLLVGSTGVVAGNDSGLPNVVMLESVKTNSPSAFLERYGLTRRDLAAIKSTIPTIQQAIPTRFVDIEARYQDRSARTRVVGSTEALPRIFDLNIENGRFLAELDTSKLNNVAVVGASVAKRLFPNADATGKNIRLGNNYFLIIGVLASVKQATARGKSAGATDDDIYIPLNTMRARMGDLVITSKDGTREATRFELSQIWLTVTDATQINDTKTLVTRLLEKTHDEQDFAVQLPAQNVRRRPAERKDNAARVDNVQRADSAERKGRSTVREIGVIESAQVLDIRSQLQSTILWILPEGTSVKKGDLLISLDASALEGQLEQQQIVVANRKADVIATEAAMLGLKLQSDAETEIAALRKQVAGLSLKQAIAEGGEIDVKVKQAEAEIKIANAKLRLAQRHIAAFKNNANGEQEHAEAQLVAEEATELKRIAEARFRWLNDHLRPTQTAALELAMKETEYGLIAAKQQSKSQLAKAEANHEARKRELESEQRKLERLEEQLQSCAIHSPRDGLIQYAATGSRTGAAVIEEGANVRARQSMLRIVDMNQLQLRVRVHESRINQVRVGNPVVVQIDAFPGRKIQGTVLKVNTTPEPTIWINGDVKVYAAIVRLDDPPAQLKLGMTAMAEISEQ